LCCFEDRRIPTSFAEGAGKSWRLALQGMLRQTGVEAPKWHDVGERVTAGSTGARIFRPPPRQRSTGLRPISSWLRKEREFSFYGDIDFIPTERYSKEDADRAIADAQFVVSIAQTVIGEKLAVGVRVALTGLVGATRHAGFLR